MRTLLFVFTLIVLLSSCGKDQFYNTVPETTNATCVIQDGTDGYIIGGQRHTGTEYDYEGRLLQLTSGGSVKWSLSLPDISRVTSLVSNGNNSFTALCDTDEGSFQTQISLVCVDTQGDIVWESVFNEMPSSSGNKLITTSDGGYLAAGSAGRFASQQGLLVKFDANGSIMWSRTYQGDQLSFFSDVIEVDEGYIAIGNAMDETRSGNAWIVHVDDTGREMSDKSINLNYESSGNSLLCLDDGYIALCGTFARDHIDPIAVFFNDSLDIIDVKTYGATSLVEYACDLALCPNGNIAILVSRFTSDQSSSSAYVIEISTGGEVIRQKEFMSPSGHLIPEDFIVHTDFCITICGELILPGYDFSEADAFILKTDSSWNVEMSSN